MPHNGSDFSIIDYNVGISLILNVVRMRKDERSVCMIVKVREYEDECVSR